MKKEEIIKTINDLTEEGNETWNHQFNFPHSIKTRDSDITSPGYNINKWKRLEPIFQSINPTGKTFLDIGCSDGFYAIEIAKMKAKHVHGTDLDPLRIKRAKLAKKVLKINNVDFDTLNLYNTPVDKKYDVVIGLGLLHRIPDMMKCLTKMCDIGKTVIVEFKTYKSSLDAVYDHGGYSKSNSYNKLYKTPSILYIKNRFKELGHTKIEVYEDELSHLNYPRTIIVASKE